MNKVVLTGRLTKEPELKKTVSGTEYLPFSVAVDRGFKNRDGERQTDFISCKAWNTTARFISSYFHKGNGINITGRIETGKYIDTQGENRTSFEVVAENVEFPLGKRQSNGANPVTAASGTDAHDISAEDTAAHDALDFVEIEAEQGDLPF